MVKTVAGDEAMNEFGSVEEIVDFAIAKEEEAAKLYTDLAARMERPAMRKVFEEFAREEQGHKAKLRRVKEGRLLAPAAEKVMDLKIADYLVDVQPGADMGYQDSLILAMKKEKASFKLYTDLAAATDNEELRATLLTLAQEEAKHKLRFEIEYDESVLKED
jgi:rubrerythrin